ncbi:MAG: helix-hairpin-helix domain-containing protein [Bacteroidota bacterium]
MKFFNLIAFLLLGLPLLAQVEPPDANEPVEPNAQFIEDLVANSAGDEGGFELTDDFEALSEFRRRPLNLNTATAEQLSELQLLNELQVSQLITYRERMNGLINFLELQVLPAFDLETIRLLEPFTQVGGSLDDLVTPFSEMLRRGERDLFLRWNRTLEQERGFDINPDTGEPRYLGDQNQFFLRFRQRYSNNLSFGVSAEKDPGEPWRNSGFDYYSAHFYIHGLNKRFKTIAVGDYTINFGQGLVLNSGFGFGKSALVTNIKRGGRRLRPYASVNEANFLRGGAASIGIGKSAEVTLFYSRRGRSANIVELDTSDLEEQLFEINTLNGISSLDLDGLHRTQAEIDDRNAISQQTFGGSFRYEFRQRGHVAVNFVQEQLSSPLILRPQPYNRFFFQGDQLQNMSIDYGYRLSNLTFFGEVARSDNGGFAQLHGLLTGLSRTIDLAILYRNYQPDYQALNARPFAETAGGRNEEGIYIGLEMRPLKNWRFSAYYDIFRHPWLRFNVDAPSSGHEYRFRLTYWQKRKLETYLEVRQEVKGIGTDLRGLPIDGVIPRTRFQGRLHFAYNISRSVEWRSRIDWGYTDNPINTRQTGFMIYQDFFYRPIGFPLSGNMRFAFFDTDGFQVRFYNYENALLYNFRIPAYYNRGTRMYLNLRYKGIRNMTIEGRIAQLFFANEETIGSGNQELPGPRRTEVGAQIKYSF